MAQTKEELREKKRAYYEANKEVILKKYKKYYSENREALLAQKRSYYRNNHQMMLDRSAKYREENKESINADLREYYKDNKDRWKKYQEQNRGKINATAAKRRAAKMNRTPPWLTTEQLDQIQNFYYLAKDLKAISGETYHVDHIVPLQGDDVSGLHVPWNLQILPSDLNLSKGNQMEKTA